MGTKKILVIEDDDAIQISVKELLEDAGYAVDCVYNGQQALDTLQSGSLPSLILLDLNMPLMNGYEFRRQQERDARIAQIPVVIMTADGQIASKRYQIGAVGFVKKPFEMGAFLEAIKRFAG